MNNRDQEQKAAQVNNNSSAITQIASVGNVALERTWTRDQYHELSNIPVSERDLISEFQNNLAVLQDLQNRMSFVMREVRYLIKM